MNARATDPYGFCEELLRAEDRDAWLASLFVPASKRPYVHAIEAFRIEIGHVRGRVTQPLAGEIRLQWWRDAIFGEARGDAEANPIAAALMDTIDRNDLPRELFDDAVEAHRIALYGEPVPTLVALEQHFDATTGIFLRLASLVLAAGGGDQPALAHHAGCALGLMSSFQNFAANAQRGWAVIPSAVLQRHGAGQAELSTAVATAAIVAALADLRSSARDHLASLESLQRSVAHTAAPAYVRVALVEPFLKLIEKSPKDPFQYAPELAAWRRQWILWRASRKGGVGL